MKWRKVDKSTTERPTKGGYSDWKELLAIEGKHRCVYCCIFEGHFGGIRNFHVEHYRPKAKRPDLVNAYDNLFYACGICNVLKSDDWHEPPAEGFDAPFYPNPEHVDYSVLFQINRETAEVSGVSIAGKYLVERLHLNRAQVLRNRKFHFLLEDLEDVKRNLDALAKDANDAEIRQLYACVSGVADILQSFHRAVQYERAEERA